MSRKHQPVVTGFNVRPITYPDGHWMNRFWGPLVSGVLNVAGRFPTYRYILRAHPVAQEMLDTGAPVIFGCVHQDAFDCFNGLPRVLKGRRLAAIVSYSRDGGLASRGLDMLGYEVVRGSSSRGGGEALLMLKAGLASNRSVVMACDGPKAPLGDVKPGIVQLAAKSGAPILPVRAWGLNRLTLRRSWTKAALTIPFLPVVVCVGAPIRVPPKPSDTRPYQIRIASTIADLACWASAWAGGAARPPFEVAGS